MFLGSSRCARAAWSSRLVVAFLLAAATFSLGQETKAATALGFSVRVLGPSSAPFLTPQVTALVANESSHSVTIPLSNQSLKAGKRSATQVIAHFHGDAADSSELTARIDVGELRELLPGETATSWVLIVPKEYLDPRASSRSPILELNWKTARAKETSNLLEIEIRQY
jgi:hypothetical protein